MAEIFNILKLSSDARELVLFLNNNALGRTLPTTIAVARAVSSELDLPGTRVENTKIFFMNSFASKVYDRLYQLNELFVIDVEAVFKLTSDFYCARYKAAYQDNFILMTGAKHPIASFFNLTEDISNQVLAEVTNDGGNIMRINNGVTKLIQELVEKQ